MTDVDAVIIGAGVAGLRCASNLNRAGLRVRILEARSRIGGRLDAFEAGGSSFDLGATWFWSNEPRIAQLIETEQIEVFAQHLDGDALLHTAEGTQRADGNPIDVPSGRFVDGARSVTSALAAHLPVDSIELGVAATAVTRLDDCLRVETHAGTAITAHAVVLALPPALAINLMTFTPALPARVEQLAAVVPVWMGATTKVVAVYERPFWRDDGLAGSAMSYVGPLREIHDMSAPDGGPGALFGFAASPGNGEVIAVEAVLAQLVDLFGPAAAAPIEIRVLDWSEEEFTSPPGALGMQAYQTYGHPSLAEPLFGGALTWASTETSPVSPGHIEGALFAGDRSAQLTLDHLLSTSLNDVRESTP